MHQGFDAALRANGPAPDRADKMNLYAWLVGSWEMDGKISSRRTAHTKRAVKSTQAGCWKAEPSRTCGFCRARSMARHCASTIQAATRGTSYGATRPSSTSRDNSAVRRARTSFRKAVTTPSQHIRWRFTERRPDSFHWIGDRLLSENKWKVEAEFFARRVKQR